MTDAEVVEMYNQILDSQWALLEAWDKTVVEEPPGEKQIDYHEQQRSMGPARRRAPVHHRRRRPTPKPRRHPRPGGRRQQVRRDAPRFTAVVEPFTAHAC